MIGMGTLINTAAVLGGGLIGLLFKKGLKESFQDIMMKASGVAVMFIGISGTLKYMLVVNGETIETQGTMLLIFSLLIGAVLGELADIEGKVERFGEYLKRMVHSEKDTTFVDGFVNT